MNEKLAKTVFVGVPVLGFLASIINTISVTNEAKALGARAEGAVRKAESFDNYLDNPEDSPYHYGYWNQANAAQTVAEAKREAVLGSLWLVVLFAIATFVALYFSRKRQ